MAKLNINGKVRDVQAQINERWLPRFARADPTAAVRPVRHADLVARGPVPRVLRTSPRVRIGTVSQHEDGA